MGVESELTELVMADDAAATAFVRRLIESGDRVLRDVDVVLPVEGLPPLY